MLQVSQAMTGDVITVSPELGVRDAMELFVARHVSGAPVVGDGKVLGVVTLTDLVALAANTPGAPTLRPPRAEPVIDDAEEPFLEGEEPPAVYFSELWDDAGADVAERMGTPESPEWNVLDNLTVRDAMTDEVLRVAPDADVVTAAAFMQKHRVHRVLVMDGDELLGILSTSDVARVVAEHKISDRRFVFGKPQRREDGSWW